VRRGPSSLADVETLRGIIDAVPHPIFVKDSESRFVMVNAAMCSFMGRPFEDLIGRLDADFVAKEQADIYVANDQWVLDRGEINENEEPFDNGSGEQRTIVTRKSRLLVSNGDRLLIGCITDISDFRRAEAAIRHNAEHDHMTGLANRALFRRRLGAALSQEPRAGEAAALLLVDLDGFKEVNDTLGHAAGDNVIVQTANTLTDLLGKSDDVARLGGDEFAIVRQPAPTAVAISVARAVVGRMAQPIYIERRRVAVSASVGIAFAGTATTDDELIREADIALYAAKADGRGCFRVFRPEMRQIAVG
jgi:diguanylate cyclase (GGDEF)-like protein/PAS domain S-box-containing protein